jgi:hypothetical protein
MFRTLFHTLSGKTSGKGVHPRRNPRLRPCLEVLEDRAVPAALSYSTLLNGTVYATAVDSAGDVYVTGEANSAFSPTSGAYDTNGWGAFVAKLSPTGNVIYATYLGSPGASANSYPAGTGIAVDAAGDAYVIGEGPTIATTGNAIAATGPLGTDFVAELNPTGSALLYATYLPSTINNPLVTEGYAGAIALDGLGNIYVAGGVNGSGLPVPGAFQTSTGGAFFMKIDPALSGTASVLYGSYIGGGGDQATGIAVDGAGNAYVEGFTMSPNFPTTSGAFQKTLNGYANVFVAKVNPSLSGAASLVYSTYLGGSNFDGWTNNEEYGAVPETEGGIAVDSAGNAYVTSVTDSSNFPVTPGAYQTTYNNSGGWGIDDIYASDVFVTKLNATGSALVYSTYLGGGKIASNWTSSGGAGIALDANGDAYVTGWTNSTTFPTVNPVQATNSSGNFDSFVTELNPSGSGLLFSTYLSGSSGAYGYGIALDSAGDVFDAGATSAGYNNIPTNGFAAKINLAPSPSFAVTGFPSSTTAGVSHTFTVTALNASGTVNTGYAGTVQFTSSDAQAVLPAYYTFTAADQGVHSFTVTLKTADSQSITATDTATGSITGSESGIVITPAAASRLVIGGLPSSVTQGNSYAFTVTALDPYGNVATGYTGTVHFTSSDPLAKLASNYTFTAADAGVHSFKVIFNSVGIETLTVTDMLDASISGIDTGISVTRKRH